MGGECSTTPRVTNSINRCPQDTPTLSSVMKYYSSTTEYNCGIDLHARQMYVCLMDRQGKKLVHTNVKDNDFAYFLKLIRAVQAQPHRLLRVHVRLVLAGRCLPGRGPELSSWPTRSTSGPSTEAKTRTTESTPKSSHLLRSNL